MTFMKLLLRIYIVTSIIQRSLSINEEDGVKIHRFLQDMCTIQPHDPGTFKVQCSCRDDKDLTIIQSAMSEIPTIAVTVFEVTACNRSTVTVEEGALAPFHNLENLTFTSIDSLRLETNSISLELYHNREFNLIFRGVLGSGLSLQKEAIKIARGIQTKATETIVISHATVNGLPESAISGSFSRLQLEVVLLKEDAESNAINIGEIGCNVTISGLDASEGSLGAEWLQGQVRVLKITHSKVVLEPRAFASVQMSGSPHPEIIMRHNKFGSPSKPSLPSGAFDIDVSEGEVSVEAENNQIYCGCDDLQWILDDRDHGLHRQIYFVCSQGSRLDEAVDSCKSRARSSFTTDVRLFFTIVALWYLVSLTI